MILLPEVAGASCERTGATTKKSRADSSNQVRCARGLNIAGLASSKFRLLEGVSNRFPAGEPRESGKRSDGAHGDAIGVKVDGAGDLHSLVEEVASQGRIVEPGGDFFRSVGEPIGISPVLDCTEKGLDVRGIGPRVWITVGTGEGQERASQRNDQAILLLHEAPSCCEVRTGTERKGNWDARRGEE